MCKCGISSLDIEPTQAFAESARAKAISKIEGFFGVALAEELELAGPVDKNLVFLL